MGYAEQSEDSCVLGVGGDGEGQQEFIRLLSMAGKLKLIHYLLLECSIKYFQTETDFRKLKPWQEKLQKTVLLL